MQYNHKVNGIEGTNHDATSVGLDFLKASEIVIFELMTTIVTNYIIIILEVAPVRIPNPHGRHSYLDRSRVVLTEAPRSCRFDVGSELWCTISRIVDQNNLQVAIALLLF